MIYIKPQDYDYIMNKFHRQDKPFDPFDRFIRNDELFAEDSGMAPQDIEMHIRELDEKMTDLSHPVRKAKVMEYILKNTRINCDKRDVFPAINMINRPIAFQRDKWRSEIFDGVIAEVGAKRDCFENKGIATCWPDWDHIVPNWERLFTLGFKGVLFESEKAREAKVNITDDETAFYDGIKITYIALIDFLERLYVQAKKQGNEKMAKALANIKENPPKTFYETMLMDFIFFIVSEHIGNTQVRSLSNFDRIFYKYYKNDIENGVTEEELRTDLAYFFLQFTAIGNYWNQPVFLGGCKADESTEINELSYLFLDVYDKMGIYNPKIQIKVADSTPKDFILKALDMIRRGNNSIVFVGDATIRRALENVGVAPDRARLCNIKGCYEYSCQEDMSMGMNYVNLLKPLEYALHQGNDGVTGVLSGLESPKLEEYKNFEQFFDEYKRQFAHIMSEVIEIVNSFENYLSEGDEVLLTKSEHASNLLPWFELARDINIKIKYIKLDQNLNVTIENLLSSITDKTKVISLAHITNVIGDVRPIKEITKIAHEKNILVVLDGAQSVPHMKVDVKDLDVDFLAFSAHKMCGPTGVGVLYAKDNLFKNIVSDKVGYSQSVLWLCNSAAELAEPVPSIYAALNNRFMTGLKKERTSYSDLLKREKNNILLKLIKQIELKKWYL